jgi:hypothetical protein
VLAAFARAALLNDDQALQKIAPIAGMVLPEAQKYMTVVSRESTREARHFAAVFFLLHYANVRPFLTSGVSWHMPSSPTMDSYVNSWWCELGAPYELDWTANDLLHGHVALNIGDRGDPEVAASRTAFLQPGDIAKGRREFEKLAATGTAPNYLGEQTLAWAREHPADPRVAEALSYVV